MHNESKFLIKNVKKSLLNNKNGVIQQFNEGNLVETLTYFDIDKKVDELIDTLLLSGIEENDNIGIITDNCINFIIWDIACIELGVRLIVFPEIMAKESSNLMSQYSIRLFVSMTGHMVPMTQDGDFTKQGLYKLEDKPTANPFGNDDHSIVFSSGTTGGLKSIIISGLGTEYVIDRFLHDFSIASSDTHTVFLPLSNYQQRMSIYGCLIKGAHINICDYKSIFTVLKTGSTTFLIAPPVFYETALQLAQNNPEKLKPLLGKSMRFMITGMAPIKLATLKAYALSGLTLLEAYGLTETGMVSWNTPNDNKIGTVGRPLDRTHLSFTSDNELVINRPHPLAKGYYQYEDIDNTFSERGIATGDIVSIDEDGFVNIEGRIKDIIILNSGLKFSPQAVETSIRENTDIQDPIVLFDMTINKLVLFVHKTDAIDQASIEEQVNSLNSKIDLPTPIKKILFTKNNMRGYEKCLTRNMKFSRAKLNEYYLSEKFDEENAYDQEVV